jgi:manganese/zinc/iron transport system permease protein
MSQSFVEFFSFAYPNIRYVVLGSVLLSITSAVVGCFTFLKKKALLGDVVSHSVLPGICLSFIISGTKDPFLLIIGAFISGWLSITLMDYITQNSKIKEDTATGLALSVFFGIGILLLTFIQHSGNAQQTGLDSFLFGKAASLVGKDLYAFSLVGIIVLTTVVAFYKELKLVSFDTEFAASIGVPVKRMEMLLSSITVLAVVTGIQAVGVVLMAAMLITPAAAARFWTNRLPTMLFLSSLFGVVSGISGAYISFVQPSMPTGPWMVMILSIIAIFSFFVAPRKGILIKIWRQERFKSKLLQENILKTFYALSEKDGQPFGTRSIDQLLEQRDFTSKQLSRGLKHLRIQRYIQKEGDQWKLRHPGYMKGQRTQRLHRLWELYLTKYLRIAPDHVHEDAESIEHVITPELESKLEALLDYPEQDPHSSVIPKRGW